MDFFTLHFENLVPSFSVSSSHAFVIITVITSVGAELQAFDKVCMKESKCKQTEKRNNGGKVFFSVLEECSVWTWGKLLKHVAFVTLSRFKLFKILCLVILQVYIVFHTHPPPSPRNNFSCEGLRCRVCFVCPFVLPNKHLTDCGDVDLACGVKHVMYCLLSGQ